MTGAGNLIFNSPISGSGSFTLGAAYATSATLAGANTFSGGINLSTNATLTVSSLASIGSGTVNLQGGVFNYTGASGTVANSFQDTSGVGTIHIAASTNYTINNTIGTNGGSINLTGPGTLTTTGTSDNGFGMFNVESGTFVLAKSSSTGTHSVDKITNVSAGATVQFAGSGTDQIYFGGGLASMNGTTDLNGQTEAVPGLTGSGTITNTSTTPGVIELTNAASTFSGTIQNGAGTMAVQVLAATATLSGANTYTGGTTIDTITNNVGGTVVGNSVLNANSASALGASTGSLTVNNSNTGAGVSSTLNLYGSAPTTVGSLSGTIATPSSGANTATINNSGQLLTVNQTTAGTYQGVIAGTGGFTLGSLSTAALTLSGINTYTGPTTVSAGTLTIGGAGSIATSSGLTIASGGAFNYQPATIGATTTLAALTASNGSTIGVSLNASTSSVINVNAAASVSGIVSLSLASPTMGTTYTMLTDANGGLGSASNYMIVNPTNFTYTVNTNSGTSVQVTETAATALTTAYWTGGLTGETNVWAASNGSTQSNWVATSGGASQPLTPGAGASVTISSSTVTTPPTSTVLGANMTINNLTIADTVNGLGLNADGNTLTITPTSSSTGITMNTGVPASTIGSNVTLGAAQTWTNHGSNLLTVGGAGSAVNGGAFALTIAGSGPTAVDNLSGSGILTVSDSGATSITNFSSSASALNINSGAGPVTLSGVTQILAGPTWTNNSTAPLTVTGGMSLGTNTLTLQTSGTSANITINAAVSGSGGLNLYNNGSSGAVIELNGANTYSGATRLGGGGGTINEFNNSSAFGSGSVLFDGTSTLEATTPGLTLANNFAWAGNYANVFGGPNSLIISGSLTNGNGTAGQTLTVSGTSGATLTLAGPVYLSNSATTTETLTLNGSGGATVSGAIADFNGTATASSNLTYSGSGQLVLGGANTYTGLTTLSNGSLLMNGTHGATGKAPATTPSPAAPLWAAREQSTSPPPRTRSA